MRTLAKSAAAAFALLLVGGGLAETATAQTSRSAGASARQRAQEQQQQERERGETRSTGERSRTRAADPAAVQAVQRTRGQAEAPAVAQAAGLRCQITDALWLGSAGTGETAQNLYEVACNGGLGYVLVNRPAQPPQVVDCLSAKTVADREEAAGTSRPTRCQLPQNANPATALQPVLQQLGRTCTINNGRALGNLTGGIRAEVACAEGGSLIVDAPTTGQLQPVALSCLEATSSGVTCEYTSRDQIVAGLRPLLTGPAASCQISDVRFRGRPTARPTNETVEIACGTSGGFLVESNPQRQVVNLWSCSSAEARGLGCQLTASAAADTQETELYTASARAIGLNCPVARYRRIGTEGPESGREVTELLCQSREESVMAYIPIPGRPNQRGEYVDCFRAEARSGTNANLRCTLTPATALRSRLSRDLATAGFPCQVSAVRGVGRLNNDDYLEFACDAATRGGFAVLPVGGQGISRTLRCVDGRQQGIVCELPGNAAGDRPRS